MKVFEWLKERFCFHDYVIMNKTLFISGASPVERCSKCGKIRL